MWAKFVATLAQSAQILSTLPYLCRVAMYTAENEESILGGSPPPDYVLDAIDNIDTKVRSPAPGGSAIHSSPNHQRHFGSLALDSSCCARRQHSWAIAPQYMDQFKIVLSIFHVSAPTIQRDLPPMGGGPRATALLSPCPV